MQPPKNRNATSDVLQKTTDSEYESSSSNSRTPTRLSSDRTKELKKKSRSRVMQLELKLSELDEELKKVKSELNESESSRNKIQQEAEAAKKELLCMKMKLEDSKSKLVEFSEAEESRLLELRRISQDRDRTWQSEIEAIKKQHSIDLSTLNTTISDIRKLKQQLAEFEAARAELQALETELGVINSTVENIKAQLEDSKEAEDVARSVVSETQLQLQMMGNDEAALRADVLRLMESYRSKEMELEECRSLAKSLQEIVREMQKHRSTQEANAIDLALKNANAEIFKLKSELIDKDTELQTLLDINRILKRSTGNPTSLSEYELKDMLNKSSYDISELKERLNDEENELRSLTEENEVLRSEMANNDSKNQNIIKASVDQVNITEAAEHNNQLGLGSVAEESDKSVGMVDEVIEQLSAIQISNLELEIELRMLRVQSEQWRKAADAAAAVLTTESGRFNENPSWVGVDDGSHGRKLMSSPFVDYRGMSSNQVLKKNGGVWKKGFK